MISILLADINDDINRFLGDNPILLGCGALIFAGIFLGLGIYAIQTGRAPVDKGPDLEGGQAKAMAIVWLVFGALIGLFGLYKIASGIF